MALDQRRHQSHLDVAVRDHRHHAQSFVRLRDPRPRRRPLTAKLAADALSALIAEPKSGRAAVPAALAAAVAASIGIDVAGREAEWTDGEAYISLPRPGGDAWVSIERDTGKLTYEKTDRGWVSYLNDLHKARHTGQAWSLFIDAFALVSVAFCVTGLLLLQMYANGRPSTWPLVGRGPRPSGAAGPFSDPLTINPNTSIQTHFNSNTRR